MILYSPGIAVLEYIPIVGFQHPCSPRHKPRVSLSLISTVGILHEVLFFAFALSDHDSLVFESIVYRQILPIPSMKADCHD